ncbi:MAG: hypothetical protein E6I94_06825 [Chloroflexi bacterium]|nr:MAG: hypothetical protein E6I94_06825 [Chloroflexota bacterium]
MLVGDGRRRGRLDDLRQVERLDEHRPPHAEHPEERALLVEGRLDPVDRRIRHPRAQGEEHARRVGRMETDEVAGDVDGVHG